MKYKDDEEEKAPRPDHVRKGKGAMDRDELHSLVQGIVSDCVQYVDEELSPERARATDYYAGNPFGNEEEGRSQFVLTEVKDAIRGMLPGLMRVFFGPERVVEFAPTGPNKEQQAKQETDYVHHVFVEQCNGFLESRAAFKDAMLKKIGVFKWGWDETARTRAHRIENVSQVELEAITAEEGVELTSVVETTPATEQSQALHTVEFTRKESGRPWVKAIPPEELIFTRETRDKDSALAIGHRTSRTRGELIALGVSEKDIEKHGNIDSKLKDNDEEVSRRVAAAADDSVGENPDGGEANEKITYVELYGRIDVDGDGIAELRKFCTIGPNFYVVNGDGLGEPCDDIPIAIGTPDPEPHTMMGLSFMDDVGPVQLVKSSVLRSTLDSLALSIYPRTAYVEGQASVEDILNNEIGAPMRMRVAGAVQPFAHPFTGREAFPLFELFDSIVESKIGRDKGSMGLDADALQSSTQDAVGAAVQSSQERQEELARIFAEQLFKPLFRGLRKLIHEHRPQKQMVRLRGSWVQIDPATWDADLDVQVKVAIGTSNVEQRVMTLTGIAQKQQEILTTLGPQNPMVNLSQYRNTLARIVELRGFHNPEEFFLPVDPNWQPPAPPEPQPSPEQVLAQAEMQIEEMKAMKDLAIKEKELELKERELDMRDREMQLQHERELEKLAVESQLKRYDIELKYQTQIRQAELQNDAVQMKTALDAELKHRAQDKQDEVADHERTLAEDEHEHKKQLNERQVAAKERQSEAKASSE